MLLRVKGRIAPPYNLLVCAARVVNGAVWLGVGSGTAAAFHTFAAPSLLAQMIIPAVLWFAIDRSLRQPSVALDR